MLPLFLKTCILGPYFALVFSLKGKSLNGAFSIWLLTDHHGRGKSGLFEWHHVFRYQKCPLCDGTTQGRCISETKEAFSHVPVLSLAPTAALGVRLLNLPNCRTLSLSLFFFPNFVLFHFNLYF